MAAERNEKVCTNCGTVIKDSPQPNQENPIMKAFAAASILVVLFVSATAPSWIDHSLYHFLYCGIISWYLIRGTQLFKGKEMIEYFLIDYFLLIPYFLQVMFNHSIGRRLRLNK